MNERQDINNAIINGVYSGSDSVGPDTGTGSIFDSVSSYDLQSFSFPEIRPEILLEESALILLTALIAEMFLPLPSRFKLSGLEDIFRRLSYKVNRNGIDPTQRSFAGFFLPVLILITLLIPLLTAEAITGFDGFISLIVMILVLEMHFPQKKAEEIYSLLKRDSKDQAKKALSYTVLRDTGRLSAMGIAKAACESIILRSFQGWFAVMIWYFIAGTEGALIMQCITVMNRAFNAKLKENSLFGLTVFRIHQLMLIIPAAALCLFMMISTKPFKHFAGGFAAVQIYQAPVSGFVLGCVGSALDIKLGGPRFYQGELVRYPDLGGSKDPYAQSVLDAMRKIRFCGICLCVAAVLTELNS